MRRSLLKDFIEKLEYNKVYLEQVKVVTNKTNKKKKEEGGGTQKVTKQIKDINKFSVPGR